MLDFSTLQNQGCLCPAFYVSLSILFDSPLSAHCESTFTFSGLRTFGWRSVAHVRASPFCLSFILNAWGWYLIGEDHFSGVELCAVSLVLAVFLPFPRKLGSKSQECSGVPPRGGPAASVQMSSARLRHGASCGASLLSCLPFPHLLFNNSLLFLRSWVRKLDTPLLFGQTSLMVLLGVSVNSIGGLAPSQPLATDVVTAD